MGERPAGAVSDEMVDVMVDVLCLKAGDQGRSSEAGDRRSRTRREIKGLDMVDLIGLLVTTSF